MKCVHHPETDSVAFCGQCGRALCAACKRDVKGMTYCEECLAARVTGAGFPPIFGQGPSPGVALALGFIPGVGAIYNGQAIKGMVQVLLFGSLIAFSDRIGGPFDTIFGLGAAAFYFYMVIDSYQTARAKQLSRPAPEWFGLSDLKMNAPIGAALLIGLGFLFLLDNFGVPVIRELGKFWPVVLIVVGLLLLQRRMSGGAAQNQAAPKSPDANKEGPGNFPGPQGM